VLDLILVLDSLEHGLEAPVAVENGNEASNPLRQGMELILKMLLDILRKYGVEQLNPVGQPFNPVQHEAMAMQEDLDLEPNTVIKVLQKGYALGERLVRPARVLVSRR
jgi:molecular chaperone GrpE